MHQIDKQVLAGVAVVLALIVASAGVGYRNIRLLNIDGYRVIRAHEVLDNLDELLSTTKDAETGQRGFIITGDEHYLQPYQDAVAAINPKLDTVASLTQDEPGQPERIPRLRALLKDKFDELAQTVALRKGPGFQAASAVIATNVGKEKMDEIRALVGEMGQQERDLVRDRQNADDHAYRVATLSVIMVALLSMLVVIGLAWSIRRRVKERLKLAAQLHEQQEWFRITLSSIGDAVIASDTQGRVTFINPVAEALTGWKQSEASGQSLREVFHIVNEQSRARVEDPSSRALREGVVVGLANHTVLIARQGKECPIDDSAAPIRDARGALVGVVLVFRDVTEQRKAHDAMKESDRLKDEFLATLSHELRNPLAPVRNALQLLKSAESSEADSKWCRDVIERQVGIMARLLDDLLDVSRIKRGKLQLRRERVSLAAILNSAVETSKPLIDSAGLTLHRAAPPENAYLDADPVRLAQAITNLLNNAARYTDRGGEIWLDLGRHEGAQVSISVKDTGIGIAADALPGIFEMFSQASPVLERSHGGLGVGLSLVRTILTLHGGTIEGRSEGRDRGSEFIVTLPSVPAPTNGDQSAAPESAPQARAAKCRVLVAEDNRDAAESLVRYLRLNGHEVQAACNGPQAIAEAEKFKPSVIFLDIGLPELTGYEVARHVRNQPWGKQMMLVALTGWGQDEDRRLSQEAGFDQHIVKPVDPAMLLRLLANAGQKS